MRALEVTVVKNMKTGEEIILPREELDPDQFNWNIKAKFHQDCIAYEKIARVEEPIREEKKMTITQEDIEDIYINEMGRTVIILKEDYGECGERSRLARRIMEDRAKRKVESTEAIELIEGEE